MRRSILPVAFVAAIASCTGEPDRAEPPGPLQVGIATRRMPVPVGIGTVGYGGFGVTPNPTPFNEIYPGTQHVHGHPEFKVVVFSRGPGHEIALLRSDTVGIFQHFRQAVVLELEERLGRDMDDVLLVGATHTHSGPGRVIDAGGPFALIADTFFPEFYERMVMGMADAVEAAYADLAPARLGHAVAYAPGGHNDRRCEDGETYTNDEAQMLVVERDGAIDAVVLSYAVHGTALNIEQLFLSQDVHGAIEEATEDRFDRPVEVLAFNAWGADMSPAHPEVPPGGSPQVDGFEGMQATGAAVADAVEIALADITWSEDPAVWMDTHRFPLSRDAIGYEDGVWEHPHGAVYCGGNTEADCDPGTVEAGIDAQCVEFTADFPAPDRTIVSVGGLGDRMFLTWPGEPGTELVEDLIAQATQREGVGDVMFFGYAQDYTGYSLQEDDWWQGGYEASGALWGPRQGDYISEQVLVALDKSLGASLAPDLAPELPPLAPFEAGEYTPYATTTPVDAGTIAADVAASYGPTDVVAFTVRGQDPWLGAPIAWLERPDGAVVNRPNGMRYDSDGYGWWLDLATEPTYRAEMDAAQRAFLWTFRAPVTNAAPGWADLSGDYVVVVELADGTQVRSAQFTVAAP